MKWKRNTSYRRHLYVLYIACAINIELFEIYSNAKQEPDPELIITRT